MTDLMTNDSLETRAPTHDHGHRIRKALSFTNISALYIFLFLFVLFSLWVPNTFLTSGVWHSLFDQSALTALVAIAVTIPLSAGVFDLAVGTEVGMAAILSAWLLEQQHLGVVPTLALTLAGGCVIGAASGALIVRAKIDSFIATLGMSSILLALIAWVSGGQQILDLPSSFQSLATGTILGFTYPVWIMLAVGLVVWYVIARTPTGRRLYATGGNPQAARLAGVPDRPSDRALAGQLRRDRGPGRAAHQRPAGRRRPDRRTGISASGLRGGVSGLHPVPRRPLQRVGRRDRGIRPGRRGQGPAARRRAGVDPRPVQRRGAPGRCRYVQVSAHGAAQRRRGANPAARRGPVVTGHRFCQLEWLRPSRAVPPDYVCKAIPLRGLV